MIGLDNNPYDFFGVRKKKVKSLSYLGLGMPVVRKKGSNPSFVNLIGNPKPFTAKPIHTQKMDYWGKALYRKESTKQKRLSKWGDADMDGSPNYFDCDPVNWLKDKKKVNPKKLNKFTGATVTSAEDVKSMGKQIAKDVASGTTIVRRVGRRRLTREEKISKARERTAEAVRRLSKAGAGTLKGKKYAEAEFAAEEAIQRGKIPKAKYIKKLAEVERRKAIYLAPEEERYTPKEKYTVRKELAKAERKLEELQLPYATKTELAGMTKKQRMKYERETGEKAQAKMEKEREKQLDIIKKEKKIEKERARHEKAKELTEKVKRVVTGKAAIEMLKRVRISPKAAYERGKAIVKAAPSAITEAYGKEERVATAKVRRLVKGGLGTAFGGALLQTRFGPAIRGRPGGPSGKYMIEGKPVYEEEYSKWSAEQRALNRLTPSTQQQAPIPEMTEQQLTEEQIAQQQVAEQYPSETAPMSAEEIQATKMMAEPVRTGPTAEEIRLAQEIAQKEDNIMNAPNILKGELKATGGSLLTPVGPQIMDAPNAFKGQLRTLNRGGEVPAVRLSERPQTNPYGDEYVDIELGSGKAVLKKRPREKWMTGEAL